LTTTKSKAKIAAPFKTGSNQIGSRVETGSGPAKAPPGAGFGRPSLSDDVRRTAPIIGKAVTQGKGELQRRASLVEQEANHDLKHLVGLLGLDESQQDRVFDKLARRSPEWHPAMQAVGVAVPVTPGPGTPAEGMTAANGAASQTPESAAASQPLLDALAEDLTDEQEVTLANAELDRQQWWEEIIPQLLPDSAVRDTSSTTGTGTAAAAALPLDDAPADTKAGDGAVVFE
jgi:hypothetical protein